MTIRTALRYPLFQAITATGLPAAGWTLDAYEPGTDTRKALYSDPTARGSGYELANPLTLDDRGEKKIYGEGLYKLVLKDDEGNLIWTADYVGEPTLSEFWRSVVQNTTASESVADLGIDNHTHVWNEVPAETVSGTRKNFSTTKKYKATFLAVYLNGARQQRTLQYTEDSDRRGYTFVTAPRNNAYICHDLIIDP